MRVPLLSGTLSKESSFAGGRSGKQLEQAWDPPSNEHHKGQVFHLMPFASAGEQAWGSMPRKCQDGQASDSPLGQATPPVDEHAWGSTLRRRLDEPAWDSPICPDAPVGQYHRRQQKPRPELGRQTEEELTNSKHEKVVHQVRGVSALECMKIAASAPALGQEPALARTHLASCAGGKG